MVHKHAHLYTGDSVWQRVKRYIKHVDKDRPPRPITKQRVPSIKAIIKKRNKYKSGDRLPVPDLLARFHNQLPGYAGGNVPARKVKVARRRPANARRLGIGKSRRRRK